MRNTPSNDIEFSGEEEGAQRLTPSPLQRGVMRPPTYFEAAQGPKAEMGMEK
jgi:hypothetical protein